MTKVESSAPLRNEQGYRQRSNRIRVRISCWCATWGLPLAAALSPVAAQVGNFVCNDREIAAVCEQTRIDSARFWSGADLPGNWNRPCPITISPAAHDGGGATSFQFDRGEVTGWRMTLRGRRESLLADVAPHEVDHMVRASLVRRPIPRWLDEGCATLFESADSHQRYRERLTPWLRRPPDAAFLDARDYPADAAGLDRIYTVGFSCVEFLLEQRDAAALLEFQADPRPPSAKLADHYGLSPEQFAGEWRQWAVQRASRGADCQSVDCRRHGLIAGMSCGCREARLPILTIYTASYCEPCRRFWSDLRSDPVFRLTITQRFHIHAVDVERHPQVDARKVDAVPTFQTPFGAVTGYEGKAWLLQRLGLTAGEPATAAPSPTLESPVLGAPRPMAPRVTAPVSPADLVAVLPKGAQHSGSPAPVSSAAAAEATRGETAPQPGWWASALERWTPAVLTSLSFVGLLGGTAATGGVGMLAVMIVRRLVQRRQRGLITACSESAPPRAFSRDLAEARQLLELRRSEERSAVVDALRGMFLDDELEKLSSAPDPAATALAAQLRSTINARVEAVAPVSTSR